MFSIQSQIREHYWQWKSRFLYQTLYRLLHLKHKLRSGLTVNVTSMGEWWVYNDIFVDGEYDSAIQVALNSLPSARPFVVLDLGANVGYFAFRVLDLLAGKEQPLDITMVEGSPKTFAELQSRMAGKELQAFHETLLCGLVGNVEGSAFIRESSIHVKSTVSDPKTAPGTKVAFVDLNRAMREKAEIDLLKCDIEGSELLFIKNYPDLLRRVRYAVIELHHDQCDTNEAIRLLQCAGFESTLLRNCGTFSVHLFSRTLPAS
jgi:FkbM family methyltransferase